MNAVDLAAPEAMACVLEAYGMRKALEANSIYHHLHTYKHICRDLIKCKICNVLITKEWLSFLIP